MKTNCIKLTKSISLPKKVNKQVELHLNLSLNNLDRDVKWTIWNSILFQSVYSEWNKEGVVETCFM